MMVKYTEKPEIRSNNKLTDDLSESDLSFPDDESSFHPSDYSESSVDDRPVGTSARGHKAISHQPHVEKFQPEVVPRPPRPPEHITRKVQNFNSINVSISGSSGGSPWVDDTGSSSSTSSSTGTSHSQIILSISEKIRFDEARERLKQTQKRPRSIQKSRDLQYDSSVSVSTGRHPSKPIDVTNANDILTAPPFLENVRYTCHRYDDSMASTSVKSKDIIKIKSSTPKSRIVGVLPSILEGENLRVHNDIRNARASARSVPPIIVPEFCSPADDVSSLGGLVSHKNKKCTRSNHRCRSSHGDDNDLERGNVVSKHEPEPNSMMGWIEERTNLELCLLFSVATSFVTLLALLSIIFAR